MKRSDGQIVRVGTFLYANRVAVSVRLRVASTTSYDVAGKYYLDWDGAGTDTTSSSVGPFDSSDEAEAFALKQTDGKVQWDS